MNIGLIVEGEGEVPAVPILIRRIFEERRPDLTVQIPRPMRLSRGKITKPSELSRAVELMARKVGEGAPILIFIDADDDCPAELGPRLLADARNARADREIGVVVAQREFEAWYLGERELVARKGRSARRRRRAPQSRADTGCQGLARSTNAEWLCAHAGPAQVRRLVQLRSGACQQVLPAF